MDACSSEIVLTFDAEVAQRNFSGQKLVHRLCLEHSAHGPVRWRIKLLAEWRQPEVRQRLVRLRIGVNKKMLACALSTRRQIHLPRNVHASVVSIASGDG